MNRFPPTPINYRDFNIDQNSGDYHFGHNRAALVTILTLGLRFLKD